MSPMKLVISVARYADRSPLWEVCIFWDGAPIDEDHTRTFGSEAKARQYAAGLNQELTRIVRAYSTQKTNHRTAA